MYVKLSSVEHEIYNNIQKKFRDRTNPLHIEISKLGDKVYNALMDEKPGLREKLAAIPPEFIEMGAGLSVKYQLYRYSMPLTGAKPVSTLWSNGVEIPENSAVRTEFLALHAQLVAIDAEHQQLRESLKPVMKSCTSLNQLVKVWPSAVNYVDNWARARLNAKSGPRDKREIKELDEEAKRLLVKTAMLS